MSRAEVHAGIVDVIVVRPGAEWRVLLLQRALDTRCPTAWEAVHGRIEPDEWPEEAAVRELREECGLAPERLYSVTVNPFYMLATRRVELAVVFCAFVAADAPVVTGPEHMAHEWVTIPEAMRRFAWPRERAALRDAMQLLKEGNAGAVEDVLRVR